MLDLAYWGVSDPAALAFVDPPPAAALAQARALLTGLGAIDSEGRITPAGRDLRQLPLPPRLARMVLQGARMGEAELATRIAVVLSEPGLGGRDVDLGLRIDSLRTDRSRRAHDARALAKRWAEIARGTCPPAGVGHESLPAGGNRGLSIGALLALAYPDRIAKSRGAGGAFLLANGRGARLDPACALAQEQFLAVAEISGIPAQARITLAAPLTLAEIETLFVGRIESRDEAIFDEPSASLRARRLRSLGALLLAEQPMPVVANDGSARALAEGVVRGGIERLPWTKALRQWRDRVGFLRRTLGEEWPDFSDAALAADAGEWLSTAFSGKTALAQLSSDELVHALHGLLPWGLRSRLDLEAPAHFTAPSGSSVAIDYGADPGPKIAIRVQELFGLDRHPAVAAGRVPLVLDLLSPAHRPVQVTRDLPRFWRGSYAAVKAEMMGRYPRHPWPDNPLAAPPTARAKRRPP
jgi:ATP-dependent helicase HrpB